MDIKPLSPQHKNTDTNQALSSTPSTEEAVRPNTIIQPQSDANVDQTKQTPIASPGANQSASTEQQVQSSPSLGENKPYSTENQQPFTVQDNALQVAQTQSDSTQNQVVANSSTSTAEPQPFLMDEATSNLTDNSAQNASLPADKPDQMGSISNVTDSQEPLASSGPVEATITPGPVTSSGSSSTQLGDQSSTPNIIGPQQHSGAQPPMPASMQTQQPLDSSAKQATPPSQPDLPNGTQAQANQMSSTKNNSRNASVSSKKRKLGMIAGGIVGIIAIIAGVVFGYIIPNRPENVFSAGLDRSGQAVYGLMVQLQEMDTADQMNKMEATADMQIDVEGMILEGDVRVRFDETASESTFNLQSASGDANFELSGDVLTSSSDQSDYPDVYMQLTGITALGLDAFIPGISRYDGRWIHMPSSFLQEVLGPLQAETDATLEMPGSEEVTSLMVDMSEVVRDYLLTSNEEKSVFEIAEIVGEEAVNERSAYRYKVNVQEKNFESFCVALAETIEASDYFKTVSLDNALAESLDTSICKEAAENLNKEEIDIWVDRRTKLISKIRITNPEVDQEYSELGLDYEGGDDVGLYLRGISEDQTVEMSMQTNFESLKTTGSVMLEQNGMSGFEFTMDVSAEPYLDAIEVTPPETAVTFEQMFEDLLGNPGGFTLGRQTEITPGSESFGADASSSFNEASNQFPHEQGEPGTITFPSFREVIRAYDAPISTNTLE